MTPAFIGLLRNENELKHLKGPVRVKYRDPKSGETWSGRGRMARWLADRIKAGDKPDKYLA